MQKLVCNNIVLTVQAYEEDHKAACGHMHWHTDTTMSKFKWKGLHICLVMQQSNMNSFIKRSETVWFGSPFRYSSQRDCPESGVSIEAMQSSKWGCRMCRAILRRQLMGQSFVKSLVCLCPHTWKNIRILCTQCCKVWGHYFHPDAP